MSTIKVQENTKAELDVFLRFLNHPQFPQHRNMIFSKIPALEQAIKIEKIEEKIAVESWIQNSRIEYAPLIKKSVDYISREIIEKGEKSLSVLGKLMNYDISKAEKQFTLIPSLYPFCPFEGNTFFFSIFEVTNGVIEYPKVLPVAVHEISHIILFEKLKHKNISLDNYLIYFIKELIAPIIVYQDDFEGIFKKEIVGNYNVLEVFFRKNGTDIKAFDYFLKKFEERKTEPNGFDMFLDEMITLCLKIKESIKEKREFDNVHGIQILKNPELLKKFREPIEI